MKKILSLLLAAVLLLQTGLYTTFAGSPGEDAQVLTLSGEELPKIPAEGTSNVSIRLLNFPSCTVEVVSEELKWLRPTELIVSGENVAVEDGLYAYRLTLRFDRTLTFDNRLKILYQGINGQYSLHYEIDRNDNHVMVVTGLFENIIVSSPLLKKLSAARRNWILSKISEDSYFYRLDLRTQEGFTFINKLKFLFEQKPSGYSIDYQYDLSTDKQTLKINKLLEDDAGDAAAVFEDFESEKHKELAAKYTPGSVELVKAAAGKAKVSVKWRTLKKVSGYKIRITDEAHDGVVKTVVVRQNCLRALKKALTKTVKGLERKKNLKIEVRAYRKVKGYTFYGPLSNAVTVKTR